MGTHTEWGSADETTVWAARPGQLTGTDYAAEESTDEHALVIDCGNSALVLEGSTGDLLAIAGLITAHVHALVAS